MAELKEMQEKISKYKLLTERLKMFNNRREMVISKVMEIEACYDTLIEIKPNQEIKVHLGSGVFVNSIIESTDKVLVTISRDFAMEVDIEKAKEMLVTNKKTLEQMLDMIETEMLQMQEELSKLEPEIRDFVEKQKHSKE
ncbi:MAG: prefoldin subunit alpha [Candidatus Aenigmarchaeota archaeon]|nr:prefoldin subunit alpha [Candidatus Aenigmarchaeota archaeon]